MSELLNIRYNAIIYSMDRSVRLGFWLLISLLLITERWQLRLSPIQVLCTTVRHLLKRDNEKRQLTLGHLVMRHM